MESTALFDLRPIEALPHSAAIELTSIDKGQHIVIGSPRSGKTTLLRQLVRHLEQDFDPADILVLSPSRRAASKLRNDISLGSKKASEQPRARSVSSFAFEAHRSLNPNLKLLTGSAQQLILRDLVESGEGYPWGFDRATLSLQGFLQELRDLITVLIEHYQDTGKLAALADRYPTKSMQLALEVYPKYLALLESKGLLDPSQLIATAPTHCEARYILVDDAQDLSKSALQLIRGLSEGRNLVLFGDPDSSVLGFRSGVPQGFIQAFPDLNRIYLEPRTKFSRPMAKLSEKLPPQLAGLQRPRSDKGELPSAYIFENQISESDWLAAQIRQRRLEKGLRFSDFAVVGRTRVQLEQVASALSARNVPVQIVGAQLALRDQFMARSILEIAQLAFSDVNPELVSYALTSSVIGLDAIGLRRLTRQLASKPEFAGLTRNQLLVAALEGDVEPTSFETKKLATLRDLIRDLKAKADSSAFEVVSAIFELVDSGRLSETAKGTTEPAFAASRDLDSALELFAAAQRFDQNEQGSALDFVHLQLSQSVPEDSLAPIGLRDAVQLTTASQLIDQSFDSVFIPRLQDGIWPNLRPRSSLLGAQSVSAFLAGRIESPLLPVRSELEDEIRLFYKAIGSANELVCLTAMVSPEEQPSQFFELLRLQPELVDSPINFDLRRLVGEYRRRLAAGDSSVTERLALLALAGVPGAHPEAWQGLLDISTSEPLVTQQEVVRFSPSRLDAYEKCPVHWFINNFGGDGNGFEASMGTLLHSALELSRDGRDLVGYVESNWHTLEFEAQWQSQAQKRRALKMVHAISEYLSTSDPALAVEQKFELNLGRLQIAGKIDRVELTADGSVRVVDLKTGKVPSQAEVDEHRQLAVYQLALRQLGHQVSSGRIVAVGDQKLKVIEQPALEGEREEKIMALLEDVAIGASGSSFIAKFSDHCSQDSNCQLLISKAVTVG